VSERITATCEKCGAEEEFGPGMALPPSGGLLEVEKDAVVRRLCGPCWRARPQAWACPHCDEASSTLALRCRGCGRARPGRGPYVPDWDAIGKEREEERREFEAMVAEADREHPGWRGATARIRERL
jgi:NMD protein affecting ribosome stability and mRNA decay